MIDFVNNCLRIEDKIVRNQANEYKVGQGNPQKNKRNISMKALKQEEPKIPHEDSEWLSKKSHPRSDNKDSANCPTLETVGLKKELSEYTHSDISQLREEIAEKYSDLLGPLLRGDLSEADDGVAKSDGSDVRGTWLQLMCCALPKHLCP